MLLEKFKNPDNSYRGKPFWSLNGKLEKDELIRQIHIMKEMGMGGAFIHTRTGLVTEYMSKEWLELVKLCTEEMHKLGMQAYLYDEDRWPSGSCGGFVSMNPKFRQKSISMYDFTREDFDLINFGQEYINSFAVKIENNILIDYYEITNKLEIREGYFAIVFVVEEQAKKEFYNGYTYIDTLNIDATSFFLKLTHEKYRQFLGDEFGKSIYGIFMDEPNVGAIFNGFGLDNKNKMRMVPYTYKLFDVFKSMYNYNLQEVLPELFFRVNEKFSKVSYNYIECVQQMFLNNFAKPYYEWCNKYNLKVTGHILHEDSLACQATMCCCCMRFYEHMDYPGVDILTESNRNYWVVKQVVSVAKQLGKPLVTSELYGCTGWQMNLQSHKEIGDWQASLGINLRCHHLSWYTMQGEAKRDFPASIFFQSTYWQDYKYVEDYFARINYVLDHADYTTSIAVVHPIESAWGLAKMNAYVNYFGVIDKDYIKLEQDFVATYNSLSDFGVDFDYVDEEMMSRLYSINNENGKTVLKIGEMTYDTLILSGLINIRSTTLKIAIDFAKLGGKVIVSGEIEYVDGSPSIVAIENSIYAKKEELSAFCKQSFIVEIFKENGKPARNFMITTKKHADGFYVFIINRDTKEKFNHCKIIFNNKYNAQKLNLRSGVIEYLQNIKLENKNGIIYSFDFGEELLLDLTQKKEVKMFESGIIYKAVAIEDTFDYKLNEPNIFVLDMPEYYIEDEFLGKDEILKCDIALRKKLGFRLRGGEMLQPWFVEKFGMATNEKKYNLKLKFSFFINKIPENIALMCEEPENFNYYINDNLIEKNIISTHIDPCFKVIKISNKDFLLGENIITLTCKYNSKVNLESIYLIGDFGIYCINNNFTIDKLPEKLKIGDITTQGLMFYSGKINYILNLEKGIYTIDFIKPSGSCINVYGVNSKKVAFAPFIAENVIVENMMSIEVVCTRANTFNPLHISPRNQFAYGPEHYITTGNEFTYNYTLFEEGLLCKPIIYLKHKNSNHHINHTLT